MSGAIREPVPDRGDPARVLEALAAELREEGAPLAERPADPVVAPGLGMLAAAGPRCAGSPAAYASVIEWVREGWLLHFGEPRLLSGLAPDLRLLAGDFLYARGIERLAPLEDAFAVGELADLISLTAGLGVAGRGQETAAAVVWLATCTAVGTGPDPAQHAAKGGLRESGDVRPLWEATLSVAEGRGLASPLARACEAVEFHPSDLG